MLATLNHVEFFFFFGTSTKLDAQLSRPSLSSSQHSNYECTNIGNFKKTSQRVLVFQHLQIFSLQQNIQAYYKCIDCLHWLALTAKHAVAPELSFTVWIMLVLRSGGCGHTNTGSGLFFLICTYFSQEVPNFVNAKAFSETYNNIANRYSGLNLIFESLLVFDTTLKCYYCNSPDSNLSIKAL